MTPYGQPGEPWHRRPDEESWRRYDGAARRRPRFQLTTKQALFGLSVLVALLIAASELVAASDSGGLQAVILMPEDGEHLRTGAVSIRIRYAAEDYHLSYEGPDTAGRWQPFASGRSRIDAPIDLPAMKVMQSRVYRLRLDVSDLDGRTRSTSARFTVEP